MWYHLGQKHGIKKPQDKKETKKPAAKAAPKISTFFQKVSIGEVLSKLAALDEFSFNALTKSTFIRSAMTETLEPWTHTCFRIFPCRKSSRNCLREWKNLD